MLQAGIDRRVLIHAVVTKGNFKTNGASTDILKNSNSGWFNIIRCSRIII